MQQGERRIYKSLAIGIGTPIAERPSHITTRTGHVRGDSADRAMGFHPVRSRVSVTDSFDISGGFLVRPCGFIPRFGADSPNMPSADFCHAIRVGLLEPSANLPRTRRSRATWQISQGKHASFRTRAPSIPAWPMMDRGLCLVLQIYLPLA